MEDKLLNNQIKYTGKNEGYSSIPYLDTKKKLTVGYGYNISARGIPSDWIPYIQDQLKSIKFPEELMKNINLGIPSYWVHYIKNDLKRITFPDELLENVFKSDILYFWVKLSDSFKWFDDLSNKRKMVLIDMCYQLGEPSFNEFKKMINALKIKNYDLASKEILDSDYARELKKLGSKRAIVNSTIMLTDDASKYI